MGSKICMKCGRKLPLYNFHKNNARKDGYATRCKECVSEYFKNYYNDNKNDIIEDVKSNRLTNIYGYKQYQREYRQSDVGKEIYRIHGKNRYSNKKHSITRQEWVDCKNYFDNSCAYCGMTFDKHKSEYNQGFHKEHVDYEGLNDITNCVPSCKSCNSKKHKTPLLEWYREGNPVFDEMRLAKIQKWLEQCLQYNSK